MTPFLTHYFIKSTIYAFENDDFQNATRYSPFFLEYQYKKGFNFLLFSPYFFLRRFIYAVILYQLTDFPIIQVGLNILHTLVLIFYLIKYRPFNEKHQNFITICQEFLVCIVFGLCGLFILEIDELQMKILEIIIICMVSLVIGISYAQVAYFNIQKIVQFIKNRRNKNKFIAIDVSPAKNPPKHKVAFKSKPDVSAVEEFKEDSLDYRENENFYRKNGFIIEIESGDKNFRM